MGYLKALLTGFVALLQIGQTNIAPTPIESNASVIETPKAINLTYNRPAPKPIIEKKSDPLPENQDLKYAALLNEMGISLHPGTDFDLMSNAAPTDETHYQSLIYQVFETLPKEHISSLQDLTIYYSPIGRRGLTSASSMILRAENVTDSVFASVLVHEIGHLVDLGAFTGLKDTGESSFLDFGRQVYNSDLSTEFYQINWESDLIMKSDATPLDFVSGYAMTDPFEDFAETYNWYVLHGANFRKIADFNDSLKQKYDFMKKYVFQEKEFSDNLTLSDFYKRTYDSTLLPYSLNDFLQNT